MQHFDTVPGLVPIEELERNIERHCLHINRATYALLVLIREFDERAGFVKWGQDSTAAWLEWRCDFAANTAREKVRVARALKEFPRISADFASGALSYTKVRAMTRVATQANETDLIRFALRHSASHVAQRCREIRMATPDSAGVAEKAFANRCLHIKHNRDRGVVTVTVELPMEAGELIEKALDKARDDVALDHPDIVDTTWTKRQADAFVTMVKSFLCGCENETQNSDHYLVNVHVDQKALIGDAGRSSLPIDTVRRLACDAPVVTIVEDDNGQPLAVGRKSRAASTAQRRAIYARDNNTCRFPGCKNKRFVDIHHIDHWANGGETNLDEMLLLCTKHHTLVHEAGFRIEKDFNDEWYFVRPDGIAVPSVGYCTQDMIEEDMTPLEVDNAPAGALLNMAERYVLELPPPNYAC